ncbi:MAG: 2-C-methyl-D-erythritol 2,4-cyclodiphosphate synthase [Pseudomonadota bacterium]|nr:2-C-methyl-D-erythritol 2,4-cyclodiphosphate synthase [Pseudomonadota bacterium]
MRIGQGFDAHRFCGEVGAFNVALGGIEVPCDQSVEAHSDGDVLLHSLCDALLGSLALGDIGLHFPDTDANFAGINSAKLLEATMALVSGNNYVVCNADLTLIAEKPKIAAYIGPMRQVISDILDVSLDKVSIKATTTEGMGFVGRGEGLGAIAVVLVDQC